MNNAKTTTRTRAAKTAAVAALVMTGLTACGAGETTTATTGSDQSATTSESTADSSEASTDDSSSASTDSEISSEATEDSSAESAGTGTFTATGDQRSPGGQEQVEVTVTLDAGTITAVEVTPMASDVTSQSFQEDFAANVADQVVGMSITDAHVSKVSGSSLTSQGFNAALDEIAAEAGL